jgi:transposase InsO family protein
MKLLRQYIQEGWPAKIKRCAEAVRPYWQVRGGLRTVYPFVLLDDDRVIVPEVLRAQALEMLHQGHPGVTLMTLRARHAMYWPRISEGIYQQTVSCRKCQENRPIARAEPLMPMPIPQAPGEVVAADHFVLEGKVFLVMVDVFSHYPEVYITNSTDAKGVIKACRDFMARAGLPRVFRSDGASCFNSEEFRQFLKQLGVQSDFSSVRYPQSNGRAEACVKWMKHLKSTATSEHDFFLALLEARNTPLANLGVSPNQLFLGRSVRTPTHVFVKQFSVPWRDLRAKRRQAQETQAYYFNQGTRVLAPLEAGQTVLVRDGERRFVSHILRPGLRPRSYVVTMPSGRLSVRNRRHLQVFPNFRLSPGDNNPPEAPQGHGSAPANGLPTASRSLMTRPDPPTTGNLTAPGQGAQSCPSPTRPGQEEEPRPRATRGPQTRNAVARPVVAGVPMGVSRAGRRIMPSRRAVEADPRGWDPTSIVGPRSPSPPASEEADDVVPGTPPRRNAEGRT